MTSLNEQQLSAVLCEDDKILCLAGAGTGKTTSMLERISHLVETGVDPSSILVLTFTNAAAFEMKDRYKRKHPSEKIPEFRTFHSFCYYILATDETIRRFMGYTQIPDICDDLQTKKIYREAQNITGIKSSIESLEKKKHRKSDEQFALDMLRKGAKKLMQQRNLITFDHLCNSISEYFMMDTHAPGSDIPMVQMYKERYKYIFVDEFQDTDPIQYDFVQSFDNSKIFVVGDALQAIYSFRGADSSIIKKLSRDPEWTTIKLYQNYRFTASICRFANSHSSHADESYRVKIEAVNTDVDLPVICKSFQRSPEYGNIDEFSRDYCIADAITHTGSTAILFRTNREVAAMQDFFKMKKLAYRASKRNMEVRNYLLSIGDNEFLQDWLSSYLNVDSYAHYIRASSLIDPESVYDIKKFISDFDIVDAVDKRWNMVKTLRKICKDNDRSVMDRCYDVLSMLGCDYLKLEEDYCFDMKSAVDYMVDLWDKYEEAPGTDIYIGTIHSVKGLEFDNVYVLGVDGNTFKLYNEENQNLYYVAITRAKSHLVVFEKEF